MKLTSCRVFQEHIPLTQPFTISMPLTQDPDYVIYEYACHEGNQAIRNILSAGREREKREAAEL